MRRCPTATEQHEIGDIWFLDIDEPVRLPVLIIEIIHDEYDEPAAEVAPVWTDRENAAPGDLLLNREDTTAAFAFRVIFRRQRAVALRALSELLGRLTESGAPLLTSALGGYIAPDRTGPLLESEFDPRLQADQWMDRPLSAAASMLLEGVTEADDDDEHEYVNEVDLTQVRTLAFQIKSGRYDSRSHYALAASAQQGVPELVPVELRDDILGIHVTGHLQHDWLNDKLLLRPEKVMGLPDYVILVVYARHSRWHREWVTAAEKIDVTLVQDEGVSEWDVTGLEVQIP